MYRSIRRRVLLCGVLPTVVAVATALCPAPLAAQMASAQTTPALQYPLGVAVTYNATHAGATGGSDFWMQGGSVEIEGRFYRGLGVVADVSGFHAANINSSGVSLDMVTTTFGPRYTWQPAWQPAHRRYEIFGQVLAGDANGFNSIFPTPTAAITSSNSLALNMGGGMNIALSPRLALRALQANWVRTQFPNATTNVQNNLSLGAGLVFRFR